MKIKRITAILLIGLLFVLTGCASSTATSPPKTSPIPTTSAILWSEAINHIGERTTVYGPVVDTRWASGSRGQPTFLNIGKPYPDPNRFTVVIWIQNRAKFPQAPEVYYKGRTIYVYGLIEDYKGSAQIVVTSPSQIQVK